jgi:hypothetical protein
MRAQTKGNGGRKTKVLTTSQSHENFLPKKKNTHPSAHRECVGTPHQFYEQREIWREESREGTGVVTRGTTMRWTFEAAAQRTALRER